MPTERFDAPCVGGPMDGSNLPYNRDGTSVQPKFYTYSNGPRPWGYYEFIPAGAERAGTGDTWRWHEYFGRKTK